MIYPITAYGTPLLRKVSDEIAPDMQELPQIIENMFETMYKSDCVGLAAPQVGKSIRLFVIDASEMSDEDENLKGFKKVFINAQMEEQWGELWSFNEGCLSLPDIREDVKRNSDIKITYFDENWVKHTENFNGIKARIIQHEYDHLEGKLFIDHISALKKRLIKGKLNAIEKGKVHTSYRLNVYKK